MRKEKMVTRTVTKTTYEIIGINIESAEVIIKNFTLLEKYDGTKDLLKICKRLFDTNTFKVVGVTPIYDEEVLLGMSESKFIELAEVLPPRKIAQ